MSTPERTSKKSIFETELKKSIEERAAELCETFSGFTGGLRMLILLHRSKDGGHRDEEKRAIISRFTFSETSFQSALEDLLLLRRVLYPHTRLYSSVNERDPAKVLRIIDQESLDYKYCNSEEMLQNFRKKLIKSPRHFVMQTRTAIGNSFMIDVDNVPGKDVEGEALTLLSELKVPIKVKYRTKNGWHIITEPFNPKKWTHSSEIQKDGLILLDF
jgi:hypothetical protein